MSGILYIVATPIGNLGDISERARAILAEVDVIAAEDTRHSQFLLGELGISKKIVSYHEHNEDSRSKELIKQLEDGRSIALISDAGTPLISDPGYRLVDQAHNAHIIVSPIPGPSAAISALSCCGLATDRFSFEGFLPHKQVARIKRLQQISRQTGTVILYESSHRIRDCIADIAEVYAADRLITLARELTKKFEQVVRLPVSQLPGWMDADPVRQKGEFVLVIQGAPTGPEQQEIVITQTQLKQTIRQMLNEMPLKQVVAICTELSGLPKNSVYKMAVAEKDQLKN